MNEVTLDHLETKIERLVKTKQQLQLENESLRLQLSKTTQQRARLLHRNEEAAKKIKGIIKRLRDEVL